MFILWHGTLVCWQIKPWLKSGSVTTDLTTIVVHSYKLLINVVKPDHSLTQVLKIMCLIPCKVMMIKSKNKHLFTALSILPGTLNM